LSYILEEHFKLNISVTEKRPLNQHFKLFISSTGRRPLEQHFKFSIKMEYTKYYQMAHCKFGIKIKKPGFFDSMFSAPSSPPSIPSAYELDVHSTARVYIQLPELAEEREIAYARVGEVGFEWGLNEEIYWNLRLIDFDREIFRPGSDYINILTKDGIYDYDNATRKFIKLEITTWVDDVKMSFTLPRLVLKDCPASSDILTLAGWDYVTELLEQEINLPTFCGMEALTRITDKTFYMDAITNNTYIEELYVNYEIQDTGWTYDAETQIVTFTNSIDSKYIVSVRNEIFKHKAIESILTQSVDRLPDIITKEYIPCVFKCDTSQRFSAELSTFNTTPKSTMEKLRKSIPADYLIMPVGGETLKMIFSPVMLRNEYPTAPKFYMSETFFDGKPSLTKSSIKSFNFGNLKRPSRSYEAFEATYANNEGGG
jgi:hypothetical protein